MVQNMVKLMDKQTCASAKNEGQMLNRSKHIRQYQTNGTKKHVSSLESVQNLEKLSWKIGHGVY